MCRRQNEKGIIIGSTFTVFENCPKKSHDTQKIRKGPKLEGCALSNFGISSGTEGEPSQKREKNGRKKKKKNQCCRDRETNPGPVDN